MAAPTDGAAIFIAGLIRELSLYELGFRGAGGCRGFHHVDACGERSHAEGACPGFGGEAVGYSCCRHDADFSVEGAVYDQRVDAAVVSDRERLVVERAHARRSGPAAGVRQAARRSGSSPSLHCSNCRRASAWGR